MKKFNQEFPEEVETRENQDFESEEEMISETEETDDDSEPNNENLNNYLDSANMATNLESAMRIAGRRRFVDLGQWSLKSHDGR